ncbi:hypothetical protein WJ04_02260 [Burkholderia vietnamiensis]|nr:hypothetical protein WJ04_02260 [Burkholderia vietnamiensis]
MAHCSLDGKNDRWSDFPIKIDCFFNQSFIVSGHQSYVTRKGELGATEAAYRVDHDAHVPFVDRDPVDGRDGAQLTTYGATEHFRYAPVAPLGKMGFVELGSRNGAEFLFLPEQTLQRSAVPLT